MANIPFVTVPLAAHDHRALNWLINAINIQAAGGTPTAYTLGWMPGTAASGASPATAEVQAAEATAAEAPKENGEKKEETPTTQEQPQQQQHEATSSSRRR